MKHTKHTKQDRNLDREIRLALHNLSKSTDSETKEFFRRIRKLSKNARLKMPVETGMELYSYSKKNLAN